MAISCSIPYNSILEMPFSDFVDMYNFAVQRFKEQSGEKTIKPLKQQQRDMIAELRKQFSDSKNKK
jgi:hypothetical protein